MTELSWFLNAYTLTVAAFMLTAATVGDRWGRRRSGHDAALAHPACGVPTGSEARHGDRDLGRRLRPGRRARPGRRGAVGTLVLATALIPAYVVWARSRPDAVLPLRLFASRGFSVANVIGLTFTLGMFGAVFLLSQYLQVVQGYSPLEAGLRTLPWTAAPMLVAPLAGAVAHRTGLRSLLVAGLSLQAGALVWFAWLTENAGPYSAFVVPLALAGIGMGLTFAPSATAVLDGLPEVDFAVASSANSTIRRFGVAMGIAVLTALPAATPADREHHALAPFRPTMCLSHSGA